MSIHTEQTDLVKTELVVLTRYTIERGKLRKRIRLVAATRQPDREPRPERPPAPSEPRSRPQRSEERPERRGGRDDRREERRERRERRPPPGEPREKKPVPPSVRPITLVVRTFNSGPHLPELLARLQDQTGFGELELIAVDGGSDDGTLEFLKSRNIRVLSVPLDGRFLDTAVEAASGATVVFISDRMSPRSRHWLAALLAPLEQNPGIAIVSGRQIPALSRSVYERVSVLGNPWLSGLRNMVWFGDNPGPGASEVPAFNMAVRKAVWKREHFGEGPLGEWVAFILGCGYGRAYVSEASVELLGGPMFEGLLNKAYRKGSASGDGLGEGVSRFGRELWQEWRFLYESGLLQAGERGEAYFQAFVLKSAQLAGAVEKHSLLKTLKAKLGRS